MKIKIQQIIFFIAVVFIACVPVKGQITCTGSISNLPGNAFRSITFEYWSEDKWLESDTANLSSDFAFHKKVRQNNVQARLRIRNQNNRWLEFYFPTFPITDSLLDFGVIDFNDMNGTPAKLSGTLNEAYYTLISDYKRYKSVKDNMMGNDSMKINDPLLPKQIDELRTTLNTHCKDYAIRMKGNFIGDVLTNLLYAPDQKEYSADKKVMSLSPAEFERRHLLDKIPFGDNRILLHNNLIKAINNYSSKFSKTDTSDLYLFINRLMFKRKGNEEVDTWLFHLLFNKFVNNRDDISLTYLLKYYLSDCEAEEKNSNQSSYSMLTAMRNCEVGKKAFNLSLPDTLGANVSLSEIAPKHKMTLLFFWRSDCSHCREFEPVLAKLYEKYKPLGLEVIAVSMDIDEFKWRIFLQANRMSWINLHVPDYEHRELVNKNFPIPGTPSLVAIDNNSVVLNRMVNRTTLENYLEQVLKK